MQEHCMLFLSLFNIHSNNVYLTWQLTPTIPVLAVTGRAQGMAGPNVFYG